MKKAENTNETEPHFDNRTEITVQRANSWLQKTCFIWHIFFRWCDKKRSIRQRHQVTRFHTTKDERIPHPMQYIWFVLMSSFLLVRSDIFSGYGLSFFLSFCLLCVQWLFTVSFSHSVAKCNAYRSSFKNGIVRSLLNAIYAFMFTGTFCSASSFFGMFNCLPIE